LDGATVTNSSKTSLTLEGNTVVNTAKSESNVLVHKKSSSANMSRSKSDNTPSSATHASSLSIGSISEGMFARKTVPALKPNKSALSTMIADASGSSNPFGELYAAISGRGQASTTSVTVFFPHAANAGKPMELKVRGDATVEEVIGFALWSYWEEGWLPKLDDGLGPDDPKREVLLSAVGWILRIAEDDGEVDDDFPREPSHPVPP
jgi:target of rapamycin complex 2 subunit MAPKAP1